MIRYLAQISREPHRRFLLGMLALTAYHTCASQTADLPLVPRVDQRVELLSIIFHLAGNEEYNQSPLNNYTADIDSYFGRYKDHGAVQLARKLAKEREVGYDGPMAIAVHLSEAPDFNPIVPISQVPVGWKDDGGQFVKLLSEFYHDTNFQNFFAAHRELYELAESRFDNVVRGVDLNWYTTFYGEAPKARYHVILGMNNGGNNYGPRVILPDGYEERYSIVGCWTKDSSGAPTFDKDYLPFIVHEFNHSFVNPIVDESKKDFSLADRVYDPVADKMRSLEYATSEVMVQESLVRAGVILYLESKGASKDDVRRMTRNEQNDGFLWMDELCDLLRQYESQRARYRTFRSFMPAIVEFHRTLAAHISEKIAAFNQKCVHVARIEPFLNHSETVAPEMKELVVTFDKPLDPNRISILNSPEGDEHYPISGAAVFLNGNRSLKLPLALKPNWSYSFVLSSLAFATPDGYPLVDYTVRFKTTNH